MKSLHPGPSFPFYSVPFRSARETNSREGQLPYSHTSSPAHFLSRHWCQGHSNARSFVPVPHWLDRDIDRDKKESAGGLLIVGNFFLFLPFALTDRPAARPTALSGFGRRSAPSASWSLSKRASQPAQLNSFLSCFASVNQSGDDDRDQKRTRSSIHAPPPAAKIQFPNWFWHQHRQTCVERAVEATRGLSSDISVCRQCSIDLAARPKRPQDVCMETGTDCGIVNAVYPLTILDGET